jgi:hypothetical protein
VILIGLSVRIVEKVYPEIRRDLYRSNMDIKVERFVNLCVLLSMVFSLIFCIVAAIFFYLFKKPVYNAFVLFPFFWLIIMTFFIRIPRFNTVSLGRKIEAEIAVTGRRLLIQLESGKSLVNSLLDLSKSRSSSIALERLANELYTGKPLEIVIAEAIDNSPSPTFKKLFIQIRNSLRTGSDLKQTVKATLEDITRHKIVEFESFGKKLSPVGLFYMIFGTILPSLGIVVFIMLLTFFGIPINSSTMWIFLVPVILVQAIFIMIFSRMRPELEL